MKSATRAIRVGQDPDSQFGAVINPICQSATFVWKTLDEIPPHDYTRVSNPNRDSLEKVLASLENGKFCTCFSSGMAAIMAAFSLLQVGDHILVAGDIYGGTFRVAEKLLPKQGISVSYFDSSNPHTIKDVVKLTTKLLIFETPSNPNLRVADIEAVVQIAKEFDILTVFDNTFASPALQQPLNLGVDIVVHSTTKYISGHSDVIGGCLVTNTEWIANEVFEYAKAVGSSPSPFDCWLTVRGVKTLSVRVKQHCENALLVARFLESHPLVQKVHYPGLESHPDHEVASRQMIGGFGGMIAFELLGGADAARAVAENTSIFLLAESLGGVESLIGYPPLMSHATMTEEERLDRGVPPNLLRLSVGIEDVEDLIADLDNALGLTQGIRIPEFAQAVQKN